MTAFSVYFSVNPTKLVLILTQTSLSQNPDAQAVFALARQARQAQDFVAAMQFFRVALQLQPDFVPAYNNLANLLQSQGELDAAAELYAQALQFNPQHAMLHCNLASLWQLQGHDAQAIAGYQHALSLKPDLLSAQHNLANLFSKQGQFAAAEAAYQAALRLCPESAEIHMDRGHLLRQAGFMEQAVSCFQTAARLQPELSMVHNNLGAALKLHGDVAAAKRCFAKALAMEPDSDVAHFNIGQIVEEEGKLELALTHYERALELKPAAIHVLLHLNFLRLKLADWQDYAQHVQEIISLTEANLAQDDNARELSTFMLAAFPVPMALRKKVAQQRAQLHERGVATLKQFQHRPMSTRPQRLRIGYVSPDFRLHAVGTLIQALFQYHQRPEFEIFAYSLVPVQDEYTAGIREGCDHYIDVWQQSPLEIAQRIQADGIHILVDLAGHTANTCIELFALRPAPIQIQYLGNPGTVGAEYIPYILADEVLIPPALRTHYTEQIVYLPHAWVASPMTIADATLTRSDFGLPEQGVVFCCFNGVHKIDPQVFGVWMWILLNVPDSVLWLFDGNSPAACDNLRQHALDLGVTAERLIFTSISAHDDYLAKYRLADLFLDTLVYNAGATAVGALAAGLPVLTCPQEQYAARMGASICHAIGMDELICSSASAYEELAIALGNDPARLQALKAKLLQQQATAPLFQPALFVKNLEHTFNNLWQTYLEAQPMTESATAASTSGNATPSHSSENLVGTHDNVRMHSSEQLYQWLDNEHISLAFTTYQTNRLFLIGCNAQGHLAVNERLFDKPMGLYSKGNNLYMSTRAQIWQFENRLPAGGEFQGADRLYVPSQALTTGDLNVHDVVLDRNDRLLFINTDFSCLATFQAGYSFVPLWQPPFITKLAAEDRCHLNGLALQNGEPMYATACSATNEPAGWRNHRVNGGVVMHIPSNEIIATGLSMPHSPRYYQGKLWLLNSGTGEFGYLDGNKFMPITFCPGFVRGLAFWQHYAIVGLSKLRSSTFNGLDLETRLLESQQTSQCGLMVIDLNSGACVHWLHIDGIVEELFDVVILPGVRQPRAFGLQNDEIERCVNFPESKGIIITKPTVSRQGIGGATHVIGLPRGSEAPAPADVKINYQQVYHLTPENLLAYDGMTFPSLQQRWQTQVQRGELIGVSASVMGHMIGFAVAERWQEGDVVQVELLSLYVLPAYQQQSVEQQLEFHLQRIVQRSVEEVS